MSDAFALERELEQCGRLCTPCVKCKRQPVCHYEPGCMWLACGCRSVALPDWDTKEIRRLWEKGNKI